MYNFQVLPQHVLYTHAATQSNTHEQLPHATPRHTNCSVLHTPFQQPHGHRDVHMDNIGQKRRRTLRVLDRLRHRSSRRQLQKYAPQGYRDVNLDNIGQKRMYTLRVVNGFRRRGQTTTLQNEGVPFCCSHWPRTCFHTSCRCCDCFRLPRRRPRP